jgi:hypothetical protein
LLLPPEASLDLGHEVFRKPQVIEGLLQGLGGVLRLAAVSRETLMHVQVTTLAGFGVLLGVSRAWRHGALLCSVRVFAG